MQRTIESLIKSFEENGSVSHAEAIEINNDRLLRSALLEHFKTQRNREFAINLLDTLVELRRDQKNVIEISDLMLASYFVGLHGFVEDSLQIWNAKEVDFDSHCGVDVQLIPFCGVEKTLFYLRTIESVEGRKALAYIQRCSETGDFDDLDRYYQTTHWWF